jgi:hypothetical protein
VPCQAGASRAGVLAVTHRRRRVHDARHPASNLLWPLIRGIASAWDAFFIPLCMLARSPLALDTSLAASIHWNWTVLRRLHGRQGLSTGLFRTVRWPSGRQIGMFGADSSRPKNVVLQFAKSLWTCLNEKRDSQKPVFLAISVE